MGSIWAKAAALLAAAVAVALIASSAAATSVHLGKLVMKIEASLAPHKLPRAKPAPITLKLKGQIKTSDGSHPPPLKTLTLEFDRHGHIYTKGLPTCRASQLASTTTPVAKRSCRKALVGTGRATAEIALPEQAPFSASGPMLIFNGAPKHHSPVLLIHVYAHVPAPTTFVTSAVIGHDHGRYGTKTVVQIPTIVAGQGSLTGFAAKIHRTWTYKHHRRSLLLASCPSGHLFAHGEFKFADGTKASGNIVKSCKPGK